MYLTLGLSDERYTELTDKIAEAAAAFVNNAKKGDKLNSGDILIEFIKKASPETPEELCFISYVISTVVISAIQLAKAKVNYTSDAFRDIFGL